MEELCSRLKTAAENDHLNASNKAPACITGKSVSLNSVSQESSNDTEEYTSSSTPEEQAERWAECLTCGTSIFYFIHLFDLFIYILLCILLFLYCFLICFIIFILFICIFINFYVYFIYDNVFLSLLVWRDGVFSFSE